MNLNKVLNLPEDSQERIARESLWGDSVWDHSVTNERAATLTWDSFRNAMTEAMESEADKKETTFIYNPPEFKPDIIKIPTSEEIDLYRKRNNIILFKPIPLKYEWIPNYGAEIGPFTLT